MSTLGAGVKVVILDSGFIPGTPCISPIEIRSFVNAAADQSHGTKVVQVIGSVAPACHMYAGEVVGSLCDGWKGLYDAMDWAIALKADVLNMSFACPTSDPGADRRLAELDQAGTICIASYNPYLHWPHSQPSVVSVGLAGKDVSADLQATDEALVFAEGCLKAFHGSSSAAATIAGVAACAKGRRPSLTRLEFLEILGVTRTKKNPRGQSLGGLATAEPRRCGPRRAGGI